MKKNEYNILFNRVTMSNFGEINYTNDRNSKPQTILVLGLIGVGKSTMIKALAKTLLLPYYDELIDMLVLDLFYKNMAELSFTFQNHIFHIQTLKHDYPNKEGGVYIPENVNLGKIIDRGIIGNIVFSYMLYNSGLISDTQCKFLRLIMTKYLKAIDNLTLIYLWADPSICLTRGNSRGRLCLSGISIEYLSNLDQSYFEILFDIISGADTFGSCMGLSDGLFKVNLAGELIRNLNVNVIFFDWSLFSDPNTISYLVKNTLMNVLAYNSKRAKVTVLDDIIDGYNSFGDNYIDKMESHCPEFRKRVYKKFIAGLTLYVNRSELNRVKSPEHHNM